MNIRFVKIRLRRFSLMGRSIFYKHLRHKVSLSKRLIKRFTAG